MPCSLYYYEATLLSDSPIPHILQTVVHLLLIAQYGKYMGMKIAVMATGNTIF